MLESILVAEGETARARRADRAAARRGRERRAPGRGARRRRAGRRSRGPSPLLPRPRREAGRPRATPVARRLAAQLGVALDGVTGTGPHGRIVARRRPSRGVTGARAGRPLPPPPAALASGAARTVPHTATQRTIAQRMASRGRRSRSSRSRPRSTWTPRRGCATTCGAARPSSRCRRSTTSSSGRRARAARVPVAERLLRATARVAPLFGRINVGVAVATDDALLVPVVLDADRKSVAEIAARVARARRARRATRTLTAPDDLAEGDVHRLEPRHVRRPPLPRRDQPAAGRDPRGRRGRRRVPSSTTSGAFVARRDGWTSRSRATTASSTAPTARASSPACASCSSSRALPSDPPEDDGHGRDRFPRGVRQALDEELERDERVIFFGEDVASPAASSHVTPGLYEKYGDDARLRHADLGAGDDRRRLRRRGHRPAARCSRSCSATSSRSRWTG